eukprot:GHVT01083167.1.p1 GENE.GHVT01083167.1~~GHVT01083167.1.p1  ORF type:complete len:101 (+),score=5.74 GHVT01083167.1:79-381(+)
MQSWILRITTWQLLYEQLVLYEYYGRSTFNVWQIIVPAVVRAGLQQMMRSCPQAPWFDVGDLPAVDLASCPLQPYTLPQFHGPSHPGAARVTPAPSGHMS